MAERIKITYATLRDDNEELHALYEAGLEKAKARLGALPPQLHRRRGARRRRHVRGPLARSTATSSSGTFARGTRQDVQDAIAAARRAQPAWFRARLGEAPRDPAPRRRADQRAPDGVRRR